MLSLERCRQILGDYNVASETTLVYIRESLHMLATICVDAYVSDRNSAAAMGNNGAGPGLEQLSDPLLAEQLAEIEERAAIQEYDGGLDRDTAERSALANYLKRNME